MLTWLHSRWCVEVDVYLETWHIWRRLQLRGRAVLLLCGELNCSAFQCDVTWRCTLHLTTEACVAVWTRTCYRRHWYDLLHSRRSRVCRNGNYGWSISNRNLIELLNLTCLLSDAPFYILKSFWNCSKKWCEGTVEFATSKWRCSRVGRKDKSTRRQISYSSLMWCSLH